MDIKLSQLPEMLSGIHDDSGPSKSFLINEHQRISYADLRELVAKNREMFREFDLGINTRLVIACSDKKLVTVLYFSCLLEGVAAVILDPEVTAAELTVLLARSEPHLAIVDQGLIDKATYLQQEESTYEVIPVKKTENRNAFSLILRRSKTLNDEGINSYPRILDKFTGIKGYVDIPENTTGLILFTSGTTSKPKGVVLSHLNLQSQMQIFIEKFELSGTICIANHLPLHHSDGLNQGPLLAAVANGSWLTHKSLTMQTLGDYLDAVYRERVTHFITVPTVLSMMTLLPEEYSDCFNSEEFKFIESTAGYLDESLWQQVESRFLVKIVNCYGLTETVCEASYCGPNESTRKVGTIGKPFGCEFKIMKEGGCQASHGEIGELWLQGPIVMASYLKNELADQDAFAGDWFKTGDLATCDEDGFYSIVGRLSSTIVRAGINIYPEDINSVLNSYPGVESAATIGLPNKTLGERVMCGVVVDSDQVTSDLIFTHCTQLLAKEKLPNEIRVLSKLPYGPSGKVDLNALTSILAHEEVDTIDDTSSKTNIEQSVMNTASKVFHIDVTKLSKTSNPDNLEQWDSLAFLELVMSLEKSFSIKLPPKDIMSIRNLADATAAVKQQLVNGGKVK